MIDTAHSSRQLNRTLIASVLLISIIDYAGRVNADQLEMKELFNTMLAEAVHNMAPTERIVMDTGDGAAISFLGTPEKALFAALALRDAIATTMIAIGEPGLVCMGIGFGSIRIVRDFSGDIGIVGEGFNDANRVRHIAKSGQLMVSGTYFDVISRHSPDYAQLFDDRGDRAAYQFRLIKDNENLTGKPRDRHLILDAPPVAAIPAAGVCTPVSKANGERFLRTSIAAAIGTVTLASALWSWHSQPEPQQSPTLVMRPTQPLTTDVRFQTRIEAEKAADIRTDVKLAAGDLYTPRKKDQIPDDTGKKNEKMIWPVEFESRP